MARKFELTKEYVDNLKEIIEQQNKQEAKSLMDELHAVEIAEIYDELNIDEAKFLYLLLEDEIASDVLAELEDDDRERFMKVLPPELIASKFIANMDTDDAADVLNDMPELKKDQVLSKLKDVGLAGDIIDLMHYDEDTAGGLMAKELIQGNLNWDIMTCLKEMRKQSEEIDEVYYVYVVDDNFVLKGTLSLKRMILANPGTKISEIYNHDVISIHAEESSEDVAKLMKKYDLVALPVTDLIGRLLGRITIDDVVDVIAEEAEKDYQMASGLSEDVEPSDSVWMLTRARFPWLLIGLIGGILGSVVIGAFEGQLLANAATAFFIPLIAAMGGNVGVQSAAIVVQGLANDTIGLESTFQKVLKEVSVAVINGLTLSFLVFVYNLIFSPSFVLTIAVSVSLFVVIIFASAFGTFVPLTLNKFKIDPAVATGPFITTINDILGLFIYMYLVKITFEMYA